MRICNIKRLAYFEDLEKDPEVSESMEKAGKDDYLKDIVMPFQYTPENMHRLFEMFQEGIIDSRPITVQSGSGVEWVWKNKSEQTHRGNGLPAVVSSRHNIWHWFTNGRPDRSDGPASINLGEYNISISWYKNGTFIAKHTYQNGRSGYECVGGPGAAGRPTACTKEEYDRIIQGYFPAAKDFYAQDYLIMQDADADRIRGGMTKKAYFDTLPDLPGIDWGIFEPQGFGQDMPIGQVSTEGYSSHEIVEACIKFFTSENKQWGVNDVLMNSRYYIGTHLTTDEYTEDGRKFFDFVTTDTARKTIFYCGEIKAQK